MKRPIFFLESTVSGRKDEGEFTNLRSFVVMVVYFHTRELNLYTLGLQKHHPGRKTIFQIVKSTGIPEPGNFSCVCLHTAWRLVWQPAFRSVCSLISQLPLAWSTKLHLRTTLFFFKPFVQIERLGLQAKVHCSLQHGTVIQSHFHWCYWPVWDWWPDAATMGFSGAATTLGTEVFIFNRRTKLRALTGTFNCYEYPNSAFHWKNVFLYVDSTRSLTSTLAIWFRAFVIKVRICQTSLRILSQSTSKQNKTNKNSNQQVGSLKSLDSCIRKAKNSIC